MRERASAVLRQAGLAGPNVDAILLALKGRNANFEKIEGMLDQMAKKHGRRAKG
jgi:hypothetical protein